VRRQSASRAAVASFDAALNRAEVAEGLTVLEPLG